MFLLNAFNPVGHRPYVVAPETDEESSPFCVRRYTCNWIYGEWMCVCISTSATGAKEQAQRIDTHTENGFACAGFGWNADTICVKASACRKISGPYLSALGDKNTHTQTRLMLYYCLCIYSIMWGAPRTLPNKPQNSETRCYVAVAVFGKRIIAFVGPRNFNQEPPVWFAEWPFSHRVWVWGSAHTHTHIHVYTAMAKWICV